MPADPVTISWGVMPPSTNRSRGRHVQHTHATKKRLQGDIHILLLEARLPRGLTAVTARATLRFPVHRRRDPVNYWLLDKALGDALVAGGWLPDDTPEHYQYALGFAPETGSPCTTIVLTPSESPL
jgi:hypothetical protein